MKELQWFKENISLYMKCHLYWNAYLQVYYNVKEPSDECYKIIADTSISTYLKSDDVDMSVEKIAYFLSRNYEKGKISLEQIESSSSYDVMDGVYYEDVEYLINEE